LITFDSVLALAQGSPTVPTPTPISQGNVNANGTPSSAYLSSFASTGMPPVAFGANTIPPAAAYTPPPSCPNGAMWIYPELVPAGNGTYTTKFTLSYPGPPAEGATPQTTAYSTYVGWMNSGAYNPSTVEDQLPSQTLQSQLSLSTKMANTMTRAIDFLFDHIDGAFGWGGKPPTFTAADFPVNIPPATNGGTAYAPYVGATWDVRIMVDITSTTHYVQIPTYKLEPVQTGTQQVQTGSTTNAQGQTVPVYTTEPVYTNEEVQQPGYSQGGLFCTNVTVMQAPPTLIKPSPAVPSSNTIPGGAVNIAFNLWRCWNPGYIATDPSTGTEANSVSLNSCNYNGNESNYYLSAIDALGHDQQVSNPTYVNIPTCMWLSTQRPASTVSIALPPQTATGNTAYGPVKITVYVQLTIVPGAVTWTYTSPDGSSSSVFSSRGTAPRTNPKYNKTTQQWTAPSGPICHTYTKVGNGYSVTATQPFQFVVTGWFNNGVTGTTYFPTKAWTSTATWTRTGINVYQIEGIPVIK
ncbi:MAG: hypothetical protein ACP5OR_08095, partial [Candidatus Dormibacteria bacterium]